MKKFISIILSCFITINLFSYSGLFSGAEEVKIVKTKWFDIIYSSSSQENASILYDNADKIYEEVTGQYGLEPTFRMPVVITDQVDMYNAFNTPVPYNRIVLYNTTTNSLDDASALDQLFLTTFRHELTHAVTFNIKNGFWTGVTKVLGDPVLPGCIFVTPGMAEGAAVASESVNGDGRLNDDFATHFIKQAKIEDCFPSYYDVQGANSSSTLALHYYFNGPFHGYLQEKYGLEKYTQFWHRVINMNRPGVNWSFKKTYGNSIRKEWKLFEENYEIPEVIKNPIENNIVSDFFIPDNNKSSINNSSGARFTDLQKCDSGLFFTREMLKDRSSKEIFFVANNQLNNKDVKPKSVFIQQLMEGFTVSTDGRFLAISYYSNAKPNITSKIKILDLENNSTYFLEEDSLKNGAIIKFQNEYYFVCHKFISPSSNLVIKKLIFENNKIVGIENIYEKPENINCFISNFIDLENGTFAFIKKTGNIFGITICDLQGNVIKEYNLPTGIRIRHLSKNEDELCFSWVKKGSMVRFGTFNITSEKFNLSNIDISGGIFNPVLINYDDCQRLAYIGCFFNENKILTIDSSSQILTDSSKVETFKANPEKAQDVKVEVTDISTISEPYKKLNNLHKGIIIPFSLYTADLIGENYGSNSPSQLLPIGITYVTANPWNGGSVSDDLLIMTAGWSYLTNSFGLETILNQGTGTSLFSYSLDLKTEFDRKGWKQSGGSLQLGSGFYFGETSTFIVQNNFEIAGGRQNNLKNYSNYLSHFAFWDKSVFESNAPVKNDLALNIFNILSTEYSNICSRGVGKYEQGGLAVVLSAGYVYDSVKGQAIILNSNLSIRIPKLIPVIQKRGFTYNLPVKINCSIFPYSTNFGLTGLSPEIGKSSVLDSKIEMILFGMDIQKSIPYAEALFINDFKISAGYTSSIATYKGYHKEIFQLPYMFEYFENLGNGKSKYLDSVYITANLKITPNIGLLANSSGFTSFDIYGKFSYPINVLDESQRKPQFSFGFNGNF